MAEEARHVIPKWHANKELLRKHFLLELDGKTGAGVYIWPSVEAAQKAHNEEWRQSVIKRTGGAPTIRYFDLFLLIDNEKGTVTEFPEAAEIQSARPERSSLPNLDAGSRFSRPAKVGAGRPRMTECMLWAVFTLIAAAAQTARNAMQRELTATLGTVGATHVRFLFGFPFALIFLAGLLAVTGASLPATPLAFWPWVLAGAFAQIAATALMLSAMGERSFVVAYAYIKTEPVQVALFGLIFLGDSITPLSAVAILIATAGVIVMSLKPGAGQRRHHALDADRALAAARMFALSAIGYRGAILSLQHSGLRAGGDLHRQPSGW